jgi:hypothetical protein
MSDETKAEERPRGWWVNFQPACHQCEHWCPNEHDQGAGQCRHDPPVNHLVGDGGVVALWPVTQPDGWCSHWWPGDPELATCRSCRWSSLLDEVAENVDLIHCCQQDDALIPATALCSRWRVKRGGGA